MDLLSGTYTIEEVCSDLKTQFNTATELAQMLSLLHEAIHENNEEASRFIADKVLDLKSVLSFHSAMFFIEEGQLVSITNSPPYGMN